MVLENHVTDEQLTDPVDGASTAIAAGRIGLIASHSNTQFNNLDASRIDRPTPATWAWQTYGGGLSIDTANSRAQLDAGPASGAFGVAVYQGFYDNDYSIEAGTSGANQNLAFRVQDRGTYYRLGVEVPTAQVVLQKLVNGQPGELLRVTVSGLVLTQPQNWRIKMSGTNHDNLDVWMQVNGQGTWQHAIDSGGNGAGRLDDIPAGYAGLSVPCRCESFKIGYNTSGADGALDQVLFTDGFDGPLSVTLTYDANGNLTGDGLYRYTYDAWNRLVRVQRRGPGTEPDDWHEIALYGYDGLGRRVRKTVSHSGDRNRQEYFYYNQRWQLLEIGDADGQARQQFVWGSQYIDEPICMDVDTGTDGNRTDATSRRFFYCQDANYNVIALREGGDIIERYEYDPYGSVRIIMDTHVSESGADLTIAGNSLKWHDPSLAENPFGFLGYYTDSETQLCLVDGGMYSPVINQSLQVLARTLRPPPTNRPGPSVRPGRSPGRRPGRSPEGEPWLEPPPGRPTTPEIRAPRSPGDNLRPPGHPGRRLSSVADLEECLRDPRFWTKQAVWPGAAGFKECNCSKDHPDWPNPCPRSRPMRDLVADVVPRPPQDWKGPIVGPCFPKGAVKNEAKCGGAPGERYNCSVYYLDPQGNPYERSWGAYKCKCCNGPFESEWHASPETHFASGEKAPWEDEQLQQ